MGQVIFEYIVYSIYFLLLTTSFIYISSLLSLLNDASVDIVDDEILFSFLLKVNSQPLYVRITL